VLGPRSIRYYAISCYAQGQSSL